MLDRETSTLYDIKVPAAEQMRTAEREKNKKSGSGKVGNARPGTLEGLDIKERK